MRSNFLAVKVCNIWWDNSVLYVFLQNNKNESFVICLTENRADNIQEFIDAYLLACDYVVSEKVRNFFILRLLGAVCMINIEKAIKNRDLVSAICNIHTACNIIKQEFQEIKKNKELTDEIKRVNEINCGYGINEVDVITSRVNSIIHDVITFGIDDYS